MKSTKRVTVKNKSYGPVPTMRHLSHSWINWQTLGIEKANAALCDSETGV